MCSLRPRRSAIELSEPSLSVVIADAIVSMD